MGSSRQPEATPGDGSSRPGLDQAKAELRHDSDAPKVLPSRAPSASAATLHVTSSSSMGLGRHLPDFVDTMPAVAEASFSTMRPTRAVDRSKPLLGADRWVDAHLGDCSWQRRQAGTLAALRLVPCSPKSHLDPVISSSDRYTGPERTALPPNSSPG